MQYLLVPLAALAVAAALFVLVGTRRRAAVGASRRSFLVLAALGAASLVAASRRLGLGRLFAEEGEEPTKLGVFAALGSIWRTMTLHSTGKVSDGEAFGKLEEEMGKALGDLNALVEKEELSPDAAAALEAAFRERYAHVERSVYVMATCYKMTMLGGDIARSRGLIEEQVKALDGLAAQGKLTEAALAKAREALAIQVAFLSNVRALQEVAGGEGQAAEAARKALDELDKRYRDGKIEPGDAANDAASDLVGFTAVRRIGPPGRPEQPRYGPPY